jgi:PKD repeat protein
MTKNPTTPASTVLRFAFLLALFSGMNALAQPLSGILPKYDAYIYQSAITFQWNSMPNAVDYTLVLANDAAFTQNVVQSPPQAGTTWTSDPLGFGTWFWKVIGDDGVQNTEGTVGKINYYLPSEDPNLVLWLKADEGILLDANSKVQSWQDLSPNNFLLQQTVDTKKPIIQSNVLNGFPTIRFQGGQVLSGGDILDLGTNNRSSFVVGNHTTTSISYFYAKALLNAANSRYGLTFRNNNDLRSVYIDVMDRSAIGTAPRTSNLFSAMSSQIDRTAGTNKVLQSNFLLTNTSGLSSAHNMDSPFRFLIGAFNDGTDTGESNFLNGNIAEIIFIDSVSSFLSIDIHGYLKHKYSPPLNLGRDTVFNNSFCNHTLSATSGYTNLLWSTGQTLSSISVNETGTYWVRGTDLLGFIWGDTIQVTFPSIPQPINTAICVGESNTWNADMGAGYTYLWSTGATTPSIDITTPGTYSVTVTGSGGCSRSSGNYTFSVDNYANTAYLGNDTTLCAGNQIALQVGAGETVDYFWNGASTIAQPPYAIVDTTGNYFLESINVNGCVARDTINITIVGVAPVANFSTSNVCDGTNAVFTDLSTAAGSDPLVIWNWNFGDSNTSSIQNPSHLYASSGSYPVILYVESEGGCGAFANGSVQVYANPTASFAVENTCINETIAFASTSTDGTAEINAWLWNFGQPASGMGNTSILQNPTRNYNELGTFNVTLLVTDMNSCTDEVTVPVTILESPVAQFTASDICAGVPITFTNTSTVGAPLFIQDYLWDFGDNTFSPMPSPNKTYNNIGFHTINLTVTASNGCTDIAQVQQFTHAYPVPNFANSPACAGTWTTLTDVSTVATGTVAASSWEINLTNNLTGSPTAFVFANAGPNNVKLTSTSDFGCTKDTMKIITVNPALNASFTTSPLVVNAGDPVIFTNTTVGATVGSWDFGDGNTSLDIEPVHTYSTQWIDSTMTVEYIVSNSFGCVDTAYTNLPVFKARFDLAVQNIFLDEDNGYYNIGVQLRNLGTSVIDYADVEIRLSNGTALKDRYENTIQGGQSVVMVFPSQPSAFFSAQNGFEDWICAEAMPFNAANLSDEDLSNNRFCKNIEGEAPVLIGPNPNPATDQFTFELIISTESTLTVDLTDSRGRAVRNYFNNTILNKGLYTITEPTLGLESGVYYLRMSSGEVKVVRKVVVN